MTTTIDTSKLDGLTLAHGDAVATTAVELRFWSKVARGAADECWPWTGGTNSDGYGVLKVDGHDRKAHRLAWSLVARRGPIPDGFVVMHSCDNPPCVNPAHLSVGTVADNYADRHVKGRTVMPDDGPAFWRNKTHCPQGHSYSGDNVRYRPDGRRRCATCYREREARRRAATRSV